MSDYCAPRYLPGGHLQTILGSHCLWPRVLYTRERRWIDAPRDFVDIDWAGPANAERLLVLFHGLEGGSDALYARKLGAFALRQGWRFAVPHFRGCSGEPNVQLRSYHAGASEEVDLMLRLCAERHAGPIHAAGVSLGANALLKWLGERGAAAAGRVRRAAAISAPLDLHVTGAVLGRGLGLLYAAAFLRTLRPSALEKLRRYPGAYDEHGVRTARTLRDFDDVVTAPVHGFRDVDDYWTRSSSRAFLAAIRVPTLVLNARNDPFLADHVLREIEVLQEAGRLPAALTLDFQREGGHVGFPGRGGWLQRRVLGFLDAA